MSDDVLDPAYRNVVTVLPMEGLAAMAGVELNFPVTIVARQGAVHADYRYFVSGWPDEPHRRVNATIPYLELMRAALADRDVPLRDEEQIIFQLEDTPFDIPSVSWEARRGMENIRLIPDLYYFMASGYEGFKPDLPRWRDRLTSIVWRGSSTGIIWQSLNTLDDLPRYRMCSLASRLGRRADVGLTDLVQAISPEEEALIHERVSREGLLKPYMQMTDMTRYRFILDIDGNANSWNFMMKLRLGCCVLRVESDWYQWFSGRLIPWEHYVPIASDLSDLLERAEWCFAHPRECEAIAERGRAFALDMKFADEMSHAALVAFAAPDAVADHLR